MAQSRPLPFAPKPTHDRWSPQADIARRIPGSSWLAVYASMPWLAVAISALPCAIDGFLIVVALYLMHADQMVFRP